MIFGLTAEGDVDKQPRGTQNKAIPIIGTGILNTASVISGNTRI